MPHLILECSKNIHTVFGYTQLLKQAHQIVVDGLPAQLAHCKSRVYVADWFYVADGSSKNAFAALTVKLVSGRSEETKDKVAKELLQIMEKFFANHRNKFNIQFSVEMVELQDSYFKADW